MNASASLIQEIETSLAAGAADRRSDVLRKVTDLFLTGATQYSDEQTDLFDDVFCHLIKKIERNALIELSGKLAPVSESPANVVLRLARDADIIIAGPILEQSDVLTEEDLLDIARSMGQDHLHAIAGRQHVSESVSEVLVDRGESRVLQRVAGNSGAQFSRLTLTSLLAKAHGDMDLAPIVADRTDIPPEVFDLFVIKATEAVRKRLLDSVRPIVRKRVEQAISDVAKKIAETEAPARTNGTSNVRAIAPSVDQLRGRLSLLAKARRSPETLTTLAMCCDVPIASVKNVHRQKSAEGMIILGKAAGLGWPDMKEVLAATLPEKVESKADEKILFEKFLAMTAPNAQRVIRFIRSSQKLSTDEIRKLV